MEKEIIENFKTCIGLLENEEYEKLIEFFDMKVIEYPNFYLEFLKIFCIIENEKLIKYILNRKSTFKYKLTYDFINTYPFIYKFCKNIKIDSELDEKTYSIIQSLNEYSKKNNIKKFKKLIDKGGKEFMNLINKSSDLSIIFINACSCSAANIVKYLLDLREKGYEIKIFKEDIEKIKLSYEINEIMKKFDKYDKLKFDKIEKNENENETDIIRDLIDQNELSQIEKMKIKNEDLNDLFIYSVESKNYKIIKHFIKNYGDKINKKIILELVINHKYDKEILQINFFP